MAAPAQVSIELPIDFQDLFRPFRYKVYWGGRGGAKSWSIADALVSLAYTRKLRIGCFREFQNSIKDSVHRLICDQIERRGLTPWFSITEKSIICWLTGSEFLFKGLHRNAHEIKSTEGIDIAWVEEAQLVSKDSWEFLIPTIRKDGSEIWVSFNAIDELDETYQRFVVNPPPAHMAVVHKVNWDGNPFFPAVLDEERKLMLERDPEGYEHVWEGNTRTISEAVIFKGRYVIEGFQMPMDPPPDVLYHGLDFGYAADPMCLTRMWITGTYPSEELWIDTALYGHRVEINEYGTWLAQCPTAKHWPLKADNSRPESISYLRRVEGLNISGAEKWPGCVEDRIAHLKGFKMIHIEAGLKDLQQEARLYKWKVDPNITVVDPASKKTSKKILPVAVDAWNHGWDSIGYALDGLIKARGVAGVWGKLAR